MADGKWVEGLSPVMPAEEAARVALAQRLGAVGAALPAVLAGDGDPEHVHRLRVSTRRADAALRIFRACLKRKAYRKARGRLRGLRRAAGAARDADVFLAELRARLAGTNADDAAGLDFLVAFTLGQRGEARRQLEAAGEASADWDAVTEGVLAGLRPAKGVKTLGELARPAVAALAEAFDLAAAQERGDYDRLHQARIAGKRLRYALEVLADCFPGGVKDRVYPEIERAQEILGRANDAHVAAGRVQALRAALADWPEVGRRVRPGLDRFLRAQQRRLGQERKRFLGWLEAWRGAGVVALMDGRRVGPQG